MKPEPICGTNAVAALFARRAHEVLRLFYLPEQREAAGPWCAILASARKPYRMVEAAELETIAGTAQHGGIVAIARPLVPAIFSPSNPPRASFLLVLDGVRSPYTLGGIARAAAFLGAPAMLIGEGPGHAMPSPAAHRAAEGGLEHLALHRTRDLPGALATLEPLYRSVAVTASRLAVAPAELPRDRPIALVLGGEEGVSPGVLAACRREVRIPGAYGRVPGLATAQTAAVLLHALIGD